MPISNRRFSSTISSCGLIDANIEALYVVLNHSYQPDSSRERSALCNVTANVNALKSWETYQNLSRYKRSVKELDRFLAMAGRSSGCRLRLKNLVYPDLTPVKSTDLRHAFEHPEKSPFYAYFEELADRAAAASPEIIGISLMFLSQALSAFSLIGCLRRRTITSKILLGGGLLTSWMNDSNRQPPFQDMVDACLPHRGDQALLDYLGVKQTVACGLPDYSDFNKDLYLSPARLFPYSTSLGCYWNKCRFCPEAAEKKSFQPLSSEQLTADLQNLREKERTGVIHFLDNAIPPKHLNRIIDNPPKAWWYGYVRFEPALESKDYCQALYESGCRMLQLGLESGDQQVLNEMRKGTRLSAVRRILDNLHQSGIAAYVYVLFGTPYETAETARHTFEFIQRMSERIDWMNPSIFNLPLLSSEINDYETNLFYPGDLSLYADFRHPHGWGRREVRRFVQNEFLQDPVIKSIYQRTPPSFTSEPCCLFPACPKPARLIFIRPARFRVRNPAQTGSSILFLQQIPACV
ncbi:MAG: B12-binding domain-containing radical SAM protein [candidate division KSB1 bacterium]|nr:B12-binding domain-containing radical SAM protein [candidate division KSB1 bacterium]